MSSFGRVVLLREVERLYDHPFPVSHVGYFSRNRAEIDRRHYHPTVNFGVFLSGTGETKSVHLDGELVERAYPVAFVQLPGSTTQSAALRVEELFYCSYSADLLPLFQDVGYARASWYDTFTLTDRLADLLKHLRHLIDNPYERGNADLIDGGCQAFISEVVVSQMTFKRRQTPETENVIRKIHHHLDVNYHQPLSIAKLASDHGMSVRSLRRHWSRYYSESIQSFVTMRRISEAQRLLGENAGGVAEIAHRVGYEDPLYFSRKFSEHTGVSPSAYRKF